MLFLLLILILSSCLTMASQEPSPLQRYHENLREVSAFFSNWLNPVYMTNDGFDNWDELTLESNGYKKLMKDNLNILSWNVYRGYDLKNFKQSLTKLVEDNDFGIILLQEAPLHDSPFWKDLEDWNSYFAPFHQVKQQDSLYNFNQSGQLILSKYPFVKSEVFELPTVTNFVVGSNHITKRIVTYVQIDNNGKKIGVYNVHLENCATSVSREKQIKIILEKINVNGDDVVILGGDFNFIFGREKGMKLIESNGFKKMFNSKFKLDHFFVKGINAEAFQLKASGSDHDPIGLRIKLD